MPKAQENLVARFDYISQSHSKPVVNLGELAILFGDGARSVRVRNNVEDDVLWEGLFGMFEGPEIIKDHTKTESMYGDGIEATITSGRRSALGVPLGRKAPIVSVHGSREGKMLTALSAYMTKATRHNQSPTFAVPYQGQSIWGVDKSVTQPFGVPNVIARFWPEHTPKGSRFDNNTLFVLGELSIIAEQNTNLPEVMSGQEAVTAEVIGDRVAAERALELAYGGSKEAITEIWGQAMALSSPSKAAEHILAGLV